jgi:TolA-binding protein
VATAAASGVDLGRLFRATPPQAKVTSAPLPRAPRVTPAPAAIPTIEASQKTAPPSGSPAPSLPLRSSSASAPELFREANSLRSQGKGGDAQKKYRELQARFPGSTEAKVSLVSLARLELGSQPAAALRHFDAYLAQSGHRTLSEEALFGRASALGRLGRRSEERAAWQELVARFPASVYTHQAEARLSKTP